MGWGHRSLARVATRTSGWGRVRRGDGRRNVRSTAFVALTLAALGGSMLTAPPTPAAPRILSFLPAADTTVRADQPTATGGSETSLAADNSPVRYSFMRFTISGVGSDIVESAKLRLYVTDAASVGGVFSRVANTTWSESTMNWNSAPPADSTPLATLGAITAATWYEVDLSTLVTGDGQFGIRIATPTSNKISFRSKEGKAGFRPELVVTVAPSTDVATPTASITVALPGRHGQRIGERRSGCRRRRGGRRRGPPGRRSDRRDRLVRPLRDPVGFVVRRQRRPRTHGDRPRCRRERRHLPAGRGARRQRGGRRPAHGPDRPGGHGDRSDPSGAQLDGEPGRRRRRRIRDRLATTQRSRAPRASPTSTTA